MLQLTSWKCLLYHPHHKSPAHSGTTHGSIKPTWLATLRNSMSFRETLDKYPKTLIIPLKKFYNDFTSFLTAAGKDQKPLPSVVTHTACDTEE